MSSIAPSIDVLILTYNGANFIEEQLLSIAKQLVPGDKIIVSDDGSTDSTIGTIEHLRQQYDLPLQVIHGPQQGVIRNFFFGIQQTSAEYVLVADQDDIWLDNKRTLFFQHMKSNEQPHLIFSDALVWQPESGEKTSFWKQQNINPKHALRLENQLFRNAVQGASMAVNRALINTIQYNDSVVMHDWWCALHASTFGQISIIHEATLLYRQHSDNQVGATKKRNIRQKREASIKIFKQALKFATLVPANHRKGAMLSNMQKAFDQNICKKLTFLIKYRPTRSNFLRSVTLWASILFVNKQTLSK